MLHCGTALPRSQSRIETAVNPNTSRHGRSVVFAWFVLDALQRPNIVGVPASRQLPFRFTTQLVTGSSLHNWWRSEELHAWTRTLPWESKHTPLRCLICTGSSPRARFRGGWAPSSPPRASSRSDAGARSAFAPSSLPEASKLNSSGWLQSAVQGWLKQSTGQGMSSCSTVDGGSATGCDGEGSVPCGRGWCGCCCGCCCHHGPALALLVVVDGCAVPCHHGCMLATFGLSTSWNAHF
mmetsp:Transcript_68267/g.188919  ORF Transcript_68267/g.188919 Transcript_68267/m.188919 type:complete len:238 (+) Transcript_68267:267-980(+)